MSTKTIDRITQIARICHEANRAYCESIGDGSQKSWDISPSWQQDSARNGVLAVIDNPNQTPRQSHESWLAEKHANGWTFGAVKNPDLKEHPCMLPYDQLPEEQKVKDVLFTAIVKAMIGVES